MGTGDSRVTKTIGVSLKKGTYQNKPPKDESYIIKDSDGTLKEYKDDGTKVALGGGGGGTVVALVQGAGISVDATDPTHPIVTNAAANDPGTFVTLGADTQDWDFATGLSGDTDGDYGFDFLLTMASLGQDIEIRPNGSAPTTFMAEQDFINGAAGTLTGRRLSRWFLADIAGAGTDKRIHVVGTLTSKSGRPRKMIATGWRGLTAETTDICYRSCFEWDDTATVINKLTFHGSAAASIKGTTSFGRWWKIGHTT